MLSLSPFLQLMIVMTLACAVGFVRAILLVNRPEVAVATAPRGCAAPQRGGEVESPPTRRAA